MGKAIDETDHRYGKLVAKEKVGKDKHRQALWKCQCDCGNITTVPGVDLRSGNTRSCGCAITKSNGHRKDRIYPIWSSMKQRCLYKKHKSYKDYGGRGITICKEWLRFLPFYEWAMSNGYKDNLTIERKDNNGDYIPGNCKWATQQEQSRNKRLCKKNTTGYSGVYRQKNSKNYRVRIGVNGKNIHLGCFADIQDAIAAKKAGEVAHWGLRDLGVKEKEKAQHVAGKGYRPVHTRPSGIE